MLMGEIEEDMRFGNDKAAQGSAERAGQGGGRSCRQSDGPISRAKAAATCWKKEH
jgi:hypothetical protein